MIYFSLNYGNGRCFLRLYVFFSFVVLFLQYIWLINFLLEQPKFVSIKQHDKLIVKKTKLREEYFKS